MAARPSPTAHGTGAPEATRALPTSVPASIVLAAALPILFLHVDYQPGFTVHAGSVSAHVVLADLAVLAVSLVALLEGLRRGFAPLRAGWPVWIAGGLLLLDVCAAAVYPRLWEPAYASATHAVTAVKFAEYGLLALAVPLVLRTRRDFDTVLVMLVAWSLVATVVGVAQIFGADIFEAWTAGRRQPSFLGHHDFAALSGAVLGVALVGIAARPVWRVSSHLLAGAALAGGVGLVISGSTSGAIGLAVGAAAMLVAAKMRDWVDLRRACAVVGIVGVVSLGVVVLRAGELNQFLRFVGLRQAKVESAHVQSYVQRTLLAYIGWRIFLDRPAGGAGWQASSEFETYGKYLADAKRDFPEAPPQAFPTPAHPWGVQNAYVQALSDLGVVGLVLLLALLGSGLALAGRAALRAPPRSAVPGVISLVWLLVVMGVLSALGLVAGIPLDAVLWIALGLAVCAAGKARLADAR